MPTNTQAEPQLSPISRRACCQSLKDPWTLTFVPPQAASCERLIECPSVMAEAEPYFSEKR